MQYIQSANSTTERSRPPPSAASCPDGAPPCLRFPRACLESESRRPSPVCRALTSELSAIPRRHMALAKQFENDLTKLFRRRTAWLSGAIGKRRSGPVPSFSKRKVGNELARLRLTARQILIKQRGRKEFESLVKKRQWRVSSGKGFGRRAKKIAFCLWYDKFVKSNNCVYVFWSGRKCMYVGRTLRGKGRPSGAFDKYWFSRVTRIDVYSVASPAVVPKAECLAIDLFDPSRNIYSSAKPKFARKCPICSTEKKILAELKRIFPLRRKRSRHKGH